MPKSSPNRPSCAKQYLRITCNALGWVLFGLTTVVCVMGITNLPSGSDGHVNGSHYTDILPVAVFTPVLHGLWRGMRNATRRPPWFGVVMIRAIFIAALVGDSIWLNAHRP